MCHTETLDLTFVRRSEVGADFWDIEPSGDYDADCARGREAALQLQQAMFFNGGPPLLGSVARAMISKGRYGPLEIGFFAQLAEDVSTSGLGAPEVLGIPNI